MTDIYDSAILYIGYVMYRAKLKIHNPVYSLIHKITAYKQQKSLHSTNFNFDNSEE